MAERTYVVQKTQIGVEATPGTAVAATKQLLATTLEFEPQATVQEFTPLGSKYPAVVVDQKEWMQMALKGYPAYGDMTYLMASLFSAPGAPVAAGSGWKWVFDTAIASLDTPKTFTIEQGDSVRAQRAPFNMVKHLGLKFTRSTADVTGTITGARIQDGITLTATPTAVDLQPMLSPNFDVFIDPSNGTSTPAFGTTKVGRLFDGEYSLDNRYGPFWVVDSTQTSFPGQVELMPKGEFKIIVEADATGMGYLTTLRVGSTVFGRIRCLGPLLTDLVTNYSFTMDMALKVKAIGKYSDQEGIYAMEWTFAIVEDALWGKSMHCEIVNNTAAL